MEGIQNIDEGVLQLLSRAVCGVLLQHWDGPRFNVLQPRKNKREFDQLVPLFHSESILFLQVDLNELIFIVAAALLLTLCIEMPVKNLRNSFARERQLKTPAKLLEKKIE